MSDLSTRVVHGDDDHSPGSPITAPIVASAVFTSAGDPTESYVYGRSGNPTWEALETTLGSMEEAHALVFSSGLAAAMNLLLALSEEFRRLLMPNDAYFHLRLLARRLRRMFELVEADYEDEACVDAELRRAPTILWVETPTNPLLRVYSLKRFAALAQAAGAPMVVDNTTATAALQRPLDNGAVAAHYSLTKSTSGHADVVLGAVVTRSDELAARLQTWRSLTGAIAGPFEAWLALRGLRTLPLRIARQSETALAAAEFLAAHPRVRFVNYPGIGRSAELARTQMSGGFGPLLSFELDGSADDADRVIRSSLLIRPSTSFGGYESSWERRARWASETSASESLIRLSIGIEDFDDLRDDLERALKAAGP